MSNSSMSDSPVVVDRGPRQVARRIVVSAPAETLFAMLADPRRHTEIDGSGTVQNAVTGPSKVALGGTFTIAMKLGFISYKVTSTITDYSENEVIEWRPSAGQLWRWELRPVDDNSTEVTEIFDYRGVRFPRALEIAKMPERNAQGIAATLRGLRNSFAAK